MENLGLVDHELHVRTLLRRLLQQAGYEVADVSRPKHALTWLEASVESASFALEPEGGTKVVTQL